jgi:hypothetical protein
MVGELFLGLLGIAIAIGASAIAIYLEMRRERTECRINGNSNR